MLSLVLGVCIKCTLSFKHVESLLPNKPSVNSHNPSFLQYLIWVQRFLYVVHVFMIKKRLDMYSVNLIPGLHDVVPQRL